MGGEAWRVCYRIPALGCTCLNLTIKLLQYPCKDLVVLGEVTYCVNFQKQR